MNALSKQLMLQSALLLTGLMFIALVDWRLAVGVFLLWVCK